MMSSSEIFENGSGICMFDSIFSWNSSSSASYSWLVFSVFGSAISKENMKLEKSKKVNCKSLYVYCMHIMYTIYRFFLNVKLLTELMLLCLMKMKIQKKKGEKIEFKLCIVYSVLYTI